MIRAIQTNNKKIMMIGNKEYEYFSKKDIKTEVIKYEKGQLTKRQLYDFLKGLSHIQCKIENEVDDSQNYYVKKEILKPLLLRAKLENEKVKYTLTYDLETKEKIIHFFTELDKFIATPNHWTGDCNDFINFENLFFNDYKITNTLVTIEDIKINLEDDWVTTKTPYDKEFVNFAKQNQGYWNPTEKIWEFPKKSYNNVVKGIGRIYKIIENY